MATGHQIGHKIVSCHTKFLSKGLHKHLKLWSQPRWYLGFPRTLIFQMLCGETSIAEMEVTVITPLWKYLFFAFYCHCLGGWLRIYCWEQDTCGFHLDQGGTGVWIHVRSQFGRASWKLAALLPPLCTACSSPAAAKREAAVPFSPEGQGKTDTKMEFIPGELPCKELGKSESHQLGTRHNWISKGESGVGPEDIGEGEQYVWAALKWC